MPHLKWRYLNNPFLVQGSRNYKKAFELSQYTDAALNARSADPFFGPLYTTFHALNVTLETEYNDWVSQGGIQKGSTQNLDQLLVQLGFGDSELGIQSLINQWNMQVQVVHPKGTPGYTAIFPQGNKPFQTGDKDTRIGAVASLSLSLTGIVALAATKTAVDTFLASLNAARTAQQGMISSTGTDSDEVAAAVEAAMIGMFSLYGSLIAQFAATPDDVEAFFDLEKLRDLPQVEFTGSIAPVTTKNIFKRTLADDRKVKIINLDNTEFHIAVVPEKNDDTSGSGITIPGLEDETVTWGTLKSSPDASYFNLFNPSNAAEGHFKVEILPEGE